MGKVLAILIIVVLIWVALKVTKFLLRLVLFLIVLGLIAAAYFHWIQP